MTIENDLNRIATALERIAFSTMQQPAQAEVVFVRPLPASTPVAADASTAAEPAKKGPGRPAKPKEEPVKKPEPVKAVEKEPDPVPEVVVAPTPDRDDFLDEAPAAPEKDVTLDDIRAALIAYAGRKGGGKDGQAAARSLLKHLSGKETLSEFTNTVMYASALKAIAATN